MMNLCLVYFLEYMCITCFSDRTTRRIESNDPSLSDSFVTKNAVIIFNFCYQIGVFLSRSSLSVVKIRRIEILTLLQLINFTFFLFNTIFVFLPNFYVLFVLMIWVGLMGGGSYVNVMYNMLESPDLDRN